MSVIQLTDKPQLRPHETCGHCGQTRPEYYKCWGCGKEQPDWPIDAAAFLTGLGWEKTPDYPNGDGWWLEPAERCKGKAPDDKETFDKHNLGYERQEVGVIADARRKVARLETILKSAALKHYPNQPDKRVVLWSDGAKESTHRTPEVDRATEVQAELDIAQADLQELLRKKAAGEPIQLKPRNREPERNAVMLELRKARQYLPPQAKIVPKYSERQLADMLPQVHARENAPSKEAFKTTNHRRTLHTSGQVEHQSKFLNEKQLRKETCVTHVEMCSICYR